MKNNDKKYNQIIKSYYKDINDYNFDRFQSSYYDPDVTIILGSMQVHHTQRFVYVQRVLPRAQSEQS